MRALALACGLSVLGCVLACGTPGGGGAGTSSTAGVAVTPDVVIPEGRAKMVRTEQFGDRMEVYFTATNKTAAKRVEWKQEGKSFVKDEHGSTYRVKWASPGRVIGPGESAELMVVCDVPADNARRFTLWLDGGHLGQPGEVLLTFDRPADLPAQK
jgi:hypothetical protein